MIISAANLAWDVYFSKYKIAHHKIVYEDFFENPDAALSRLISFLGGRPEDFGEGRILSATPLQVQRDAESFEMRERFIADLEHVGESAFETRQGESLRRWNRFFFERGWRLRQMNWTEALDTVASPRLRSE
ncbi:hypothetical protein GCM10011611_35410 [Aliidongia dinghuensis]|uniref:Sulfotransferase domain-containing protein n=2 Tax=Aliidongia dinghuensis TaxID=1867774 RepID=A0A8J3E627_9PROT|nr:hypothetical protein GCM10011611_35410 [Aliidongia dinghuensis]